MRVLLAASMGGMGHLLPVLSVGEACQRLGHDVTAVVPESLEAEATRSGFRVAVGEDPPRAFVDEAWNRMRNGPPDPGLIDREVFADKATAGMLGAARAARDSFRPHLVVREPCEYASAVAAHEAGIFQAAVGISLASIERRVLTMVAPVIDHYAAGVAETIGEAPYLSSFPASLDPSPWPDTRRFSQPISAAGSLPEWWLGDDQPLVYVTFGSVTGHLSEAQGVFRAALNAVAGLPCRVLLTVGSGVEVSEFAPVPANTHVEPWVAQEGVFPHASVVVCHGGSGTTFGALAAGVPLVVCPLFADQSENGRLVEESGAGVLVRGREKALGGVGGLDQSDAAPLREAIEEVLSNPKYRSVAESISEEMGAAASLDSIVADLLTAA